MFSSFFQSYLHFDLFLKGKKTHRNLLHEIAAKGHRNIFLRNSIQRLYLPIDLCARCQDESIEAYLLSINNDF